MSIPGMTHPVKVYSLEDLPPLMGQYSLPASRLARGGSLDEDDVDVDLAVSVITWLAQFFAQGEGAILCFLPVRPSYFCLGCFVTIFLLRICEECFICINASDPHKFSISGIQSITLNASLPSLIINMISLVKKCL